MKNFKHLVNSELTKNIENYDKLSSFVYELMHLDKQKHNVWVVTKRQQLTLMTDNPYLGTQLRYQQAAICEALNRKFLMELKTAKVKIIPPTARLEKKKQDLYKVGGKASEILTSIANEIEDDELRRSLLKLTNQNK
jgi:hypothetical protein